MANATTQIIEKDSSESEDIQNLSEFCSPPPDILSNAMTISFGYKKNVFDAWVKQPSPCCGAASIAGSINALLRLHRTSDKAFSHIDLLSIHKLIFIQRLNQKLKSFERKVGDCNSWEKIFTPLSSIISSLVAEEKSSAASSEDSDKSKSSYFMKKKLLYVAMQKFIAPYAEELQQIATTGETPTVLDSFQIFVRLVYATLSAKLVNGDINADNNDVDDGSGNSRNVDDSSSPEVNDEENTSNENIISSQLQTSVSLNALPNGDSSFIQGAGGGFKNLKDAINQKRKMNKSAAAGISGETSTSSSTSIWAWDEDLFELLKTISGYHKLNSDPYPNTAPIGNVSILQAIEKSAEFAGFGSYLKGKLFMGKRTGTALKSRIEVPLSARDDEELITHQWNALKSAFHRPDTCLLFHLTNHYTVVFAVREWIIENKNISNNNEAPQIVRQICCARKGQRPTAWIDFSECRSIMLNWEGYKMMSIQFTNDSSLDMVNFKTVFKTKLDEEFSNKDLESAMKLIELYSSA